jgi:hypothetical protein
MPVHQEPAAMPGYADPFQGMPVPASTMDTMGAGVTIPEMNALREWEDKHENELEEVSRKEEAEKKEGEEEEDKKFMLTDEEKDKINDDAFDKTIEDMKVIIKKVVEKASFMIKLNIPNKFKKTDTTM